MRFKTVSVIRFGIPILVVWLACFPAIVLGCLEDLKVNGLPRVEKKTNVVVIMGDDWSWPHASVLGHSVVQTPVFDRIAREGVLFESAFTNAPSCTPSRFVFLTGQYHWRLKGADRLGGSLQADVPVYPDLLAEAGYLVGFSRKGAEPSKHLFRGNDPFGKQYKNFDQFLAARKANQPFCYWYGAGEPHRPYPWRSSESSGLEIAKGDVPAWLPDSPTVRTDVGDYFLRIQKLDQFAGEIVDRLREMGELENTLLIMTGDNGMPFPRAKATLYDAGTRVPLAIRWGGNLSPQHRISDFVSLVDMAPTILDACGIDIPSEMIGGSLRDQLESVQGGWVDANRDNVLTGREKHVYYLPSRSLRDSKFLYIRNFSPASWKQGQQAGKQPHYDFIKTPWPTQPPAFSFDVDPSPSKQWMLENEQKPGVRELNQLAFGERDDEELYELSADPDQLVNLANSPKYRMARDRMSTRLTERMRETLDPHFKLASHASFDVQGWKVNLHDRLWHESPTKTKRMLKLLSQQLGRVVAVVPPKALRQIQTVPIWVNPAYPGVRPGAEYHGNSGWLKNNGRDVRMGKAVEITNVANFDFENIRMPYLMLHELAHAYHDQVLGFGNSKLRTRYEAARDSGSYEMVKRFTGRKIINDKAYGMNNAKEYFAESTEAFFGKNDFFPFDKEELRAHDPKMHDLLIELWGVRANTDQADE
jgi:N-sulfoglucosamine sulfohydrolase